MLLRKMRLNIQGLKKFFQLKYISKLKKNSWCINLDSSKKIWNISAHKISDIKQNIGYILNFQKYHDIY